MQESKVWFAGNKDLEGSMLLRLLYRAEDAKEALELLPYYPISDRDRRILSNLLSGNTGFTTDGVMVEAYKHLVTDRVFRSRLEDLGITPYIIASERVNIGEGKDYTVTGMADYIELQDSHYSSIIIKGICRSVCVKNYLTVIDKVYNYTGKPISTGFALYGTDEEGFAVNRENITYGSSTLAIQEITDNIGVDFTRYPNYTPVQLHGLWVNSGDVFDCVWVSREFITRGIHRFAVTDGTALDNLHLLFKCSNLVNRGYILMDKGSFGKLDLERVTTLPLSREHIELVVPDMSIAIGTYKIKGTKCALIVMDSKMEIHKVNM